MDIDLDFGNRDEILVLVKHTDAMMRQNGKTVRHNSGVYVTEVPADPITNLCTFDYKEAENLGYFKIDFLNNSIYTHIKTPEELEHLINMEPNWKMLHNENYVKQLTHVNSYYDLIIKLPEPITSLEHMAMFLASLRPGKRHLLGRTWKEVRKTVWNKDGDGFQFKKSHSFAYGMAVIVNMNLLTTGEK